MLKLTMSMFLYTQWKSENIYKKATIWAQSQRNVVYLFLLLVIDINSDARIHKVKEISRNII